MKILLLGARGRRWIANQSQDAQDTTMKRWKDENYLNLRPVHMSWLNQLLLTDCLNLIHFLAHRWSDSLQQNMDSFGVAQRVNIGPGTCHLSPLLAASLTLVPKNKKKSLEVGARSMRLKSGKTRDGGVMRFILFQYRRLMRVIASMAEANWSVTRWSRAFGDEDFAVAFRLLVCCGSAVVIRCWTRRWWRWLSPWCTVCSCTLSSLLLYHCLFFLFFFLGLRTERWWILGFGNGDVLWVWVWWGLGRVRLGARGWCWDWN